MAGHSHSSNIKHRKDRQDAKRGKVFTKLGKAITVAAKSGGDAEANPTLRLAVEKARLMNMPKDRIERAIQRGTGDGAGGVELESLTYEGYGPGGTAILIEITTDSRNRTASEVRNIFDKAGCSLGTSGCVAYLFERRGLILVSGDAMPEDKMMETALDLGAEDFSAEGGSYEILTTPQDFFTVSQGLQEQGVTVDHAEVAFLPSTFLDLSEKDQKKLIKLTDALEDNDDVASVYHNCNFSESVLQDLSGE